MTTQIKLGDTQTPYIQKVLLYLDTSSRPKVIGKLDKRTKTFKTKRKLNQIYRKTNSISFNLEFIRENDIKIIEVEIDGTLLYITKEYLLSKGLTYRFAGYDMQVFCELKEFSNSEQSAIQKELDELISLTNDSLFGELLS